MNVTQSNISKDHPKILKQKVGVIIGNLGTPDAPNRKELKVYLNQFLSDPRVIELPKILWQILLKLVILQVRPSKSAEAYRQIWTEKGSPLLDIANRQLSKIQSSEVERLEANRCIGKQLVIHQWPPKHLSYSSSEQLR